MVAGPIKTDKRAWNQFKSIVLLHLLFTLPLNTKGKWLERLKDKFVEMQLRF